MRFLQKGLIPNIHAVIFTCERQPNNGLTFVFCSYKVEAVKEQDFFCKCSYLGIILNKYGNQL